jgi:hypothetical protein
VEKGINRWGNLERNLKKNLIKALMFLLKASSKLSNLSTVRNVILIHFNCQTGNHGRFEFLKKQRLSVDPMNFNMPSKTPSIRYNYKVNKKYELRNVKQAIEVESLNGHLDSSEEMPFELPEDHLKNLE